MTSPGRVNVVVPCFNLGAYVEEAVGSALSQTYPDVVVTVVDDGSTDPQTRRVLDGLSDPRVRVVRRGNGGLGAARNSGIRATESEYVLPLDADDVLRPTFVERAVAVLRARPEVRIVYSLVEEFGERSGPMEIPEYSLAEMLRRNLIVCTGLFRRADFDRTRGYSETMSHLGWEDWNLWLSLIELGEGRREQAAFRIPEPLFLYRVRKGSMIRGLTEAQLAELRREVYRDHLQLYAAEFEDPIGLRHRLDRLEEEHDKLLRDHRGLQNSRALKLGRAILGPLRRLRRGTE